MCGGEPCEEVAERKRLAAAKRGDGVTHWRDAAIARRIGDDRCEALARDCVRDVRDLLVEKAPLAIAWREEGDSLVIAFPSDRAADEVDVIVATVRRRGENAPRRGL